MNFKVYCLAFILLLSCSRDKNKPYEDVNIIRDEKQKKSKVKQELKLPLNYGRSDMLLIELSQSDLEVNGWEKDSIYINKAITDLGNENSEVYQGNNQVIIREKEMDSLNKGNTWKVMVPKFTNLTINSANGTVRINNVNGTFKVNSPVGSIWVNNCSAALQLISQTGSIQADNLELMGRSKMNTASGKVKIDLKSDILYQLTAHSGSDSLVLSLNKNALKSNLEILTFQNEGKVQSDFETSDVEEFYSDALERYYDLRKVQLNESFPSSSISTGNGTIIIRR